MAINICTNCGFEGKGKKVTMGGSGIARVLGVVTMLPFHTVWKIFSNRSSKECPNCHLPKLVKLNSDAGRLAQRKFDIELGLITVAKPKEATASDPLASFGNDKPAEMPIVKKTINPEEW